MKMIHFINSFRESGSFALQNLRANPLRSLLSLLGVTIGIFCISAILTLVDSLNYNMKQSLSKLGDNVIYVQKFPWTDFGNYPWWKYVNRPDIKYREMQRLEKRYGNKGYVAFNAGLGGKTMKANKQVAEGVALRAVSRDFPEVYDMNFHSGRYFSREELNSGASAIIIGHNVAENLFPRTNPIGQPIKALDRQLTVIGVLEKEGQSAVGFGGSIDDQAFIPVELGRKFYPLDGSLANTYIMAKGARGQTLNELESDLAGVVRSIRNLRPFEENNFALNRITLITRQIDQVLQVANIAGWLIAAFSILVGGFGVANIMFVSVKERTPIIGIQKAIGAPKGFILFQFLVESIILCLFGGAIGILGIGLITFGINQALDFQVVITLNNILTGLGLATLIGIIAGFVPAYQASEMDPIQSIRAAM